MLMPLLLACARSSAALLSQWRIGMTSRYLSRSHRAVIGHARTVAIGCCRGVDVALDAVLVLMALLVRFWLRNGLLICVSSDGVVDCDGAGRG